VVFQKIVKGFFCHCCVNPGLSQPDDFRAIAQSGIDFDKRTSSTILGVIPGDLIEQTPHSVVSWVRVFSDWRGKSERKQALF